MHQSEKIYSFECPTKHSRNPEFRAIYYSTFIRRQKLPNSFYVVSIIQFQNWTGKTDTKRGKIHRPIIAYIKDAKTPKQNNRILKPVLHCEQVYKKETVKQHPGF